jgi:hypothetical protein
MRSLRLKSAGLQSKASMTSTLGVKRLKRTTIIAAFAAVTLSAPSLGWGLSNIGPGVAMS